MPGSVGAPAGSRRGYPTAQYLKTVGQMVIQITDATSPEARQARAAYRRALLEAIDEAPEGSTLRESLEGQLKTDPKAQP